MSAFSSKGAPTPLCQRCAEIQLDELFYSNKYQVSHSTPQETVKLERKSYLTLGLASPGSFVVSCSLCQFFIDMSPSPDLGPKVPNQKLVVKDIPEESFGQIYSEGRSIPHSPGQLFVARECGE